MRELILKRVRCSGLLYKFSMGLQIVIDREKGVYKRLKGTPLDQRAIFTETIIKGFFAIYVGTIEIFLISKFGIKSELTEHPVQFFLELTFCSITFFSIGFIVSSLAKRMQNSFKNCVNCDVSHDVLIRRNVTIRSFARSAAKNSCHSAFMEGAWHFLFVINLRDFT
jgi:hypothetical protein